MLWVLLEIDFMKIKAKLFSHSKTANSAKQSMLGIGNIVPVDLGVYYLTDHFSI